MVSPQGPGAQTPLAGPELGDAGEYPHAYPESDYEDEPGPFDIDEVNRRLSGAD